ncbi:MAG: FtsX-like permease family protein [Pseudomonadota bacterium]
MFWLSLAWKSLLNRRATALLTALSMGISVMLLVSVEKIRVDAKANFARTISGTDLIVGARAGPVNLLLYTVFRLGNPTGGVRWSSYQDLKNHPAVDWTVPLSLGDSHRGYRVLGTSVEYFDLYRFGRDQQIRFADGVRFDSPLDVVLGSEVADTLGYEVGHSIVVSHGLGGAGISAHDDKPFTVVGVLAATGTPIDRTLHVSLEGIEAIHIGWVNGVRVAGAPQNAPIPEPEAITGFLVGMKSRIKTFAFQRHVNDYTDDVLMAIIPGLTLQSLWATLSGVERALLAMSALVVIASLLGMLTVLLAGIHERRREIALLRAMGTPASHVFKLLCGESMLLGAVGVAVGLLLHYGAIALVAPWLLSAYGVVVTLGPPSASTLALLGAVVAGATVVGIAPAALAYRNALDDGLTVRT